MRTRITVWAILSFATLLLLNLRAWKAGDESKQLAPAEAVAALSVPAGFSVELVASEPAIIHPVTMTIDERGRIWLIESPSGLADSPDRSPAASRSWKAAGATAPTTPFPPFQSG